MPRVSGVDIPVGKRVDVALTYIYGIGNVVAKQVLAELRIDPALRAKDLSDEQVSQLNQLIERKYVVEGQLRRQVMQNISRLKEIKCYRGFRHMRGLPCRGQRTRTNARTRKGPRKTVARKKSVKEL
ncbi:MAG: 30S ribosomal protein S13 [Planctomycetes bacterium]|nr:30S ribosomal protein S13 [Planctomycetota bacterium]